MKQWLAVLVIVFCMAGFAFAEPPGAEEKEPANNTSIPQAVIDGCPTKGLMVNNMDCFDCHTKPSFKIKESPPFEIYDLPSNAEFRYIDAELVGYFRLSGINHSTLSDAFIYFDRRPKIKTIIINVDSYGGGVFEMWGIVSLVNEYKKRFNIITECRTTAFSAGLIVFMSADTRLVSPQCQLMWHEISSWTMFDKKFPSKAEHEAEMMRAWQDMANSYIADRCELTKEEVDKIISYKDWWIFGQTAIDNGMATGPIVE